MIKLNVSGYCHNCQEFEPTIAKQHVVNDCGKITLNTSVCCKHKQQCDRIYNYLRKVGKGGTQGND